MTLRALIVEDEEEDVPLLVRELRRAGHDVVHERVFTAEPALGPPQGVGRGPHRPLHARLRRAGGPAHRPELGPGLPVVVVTGFIGEEQAASLMKAGANDFLVKDRLFRLGAVVEREVTEARARREQARSWSRSSGSSCSPRRWRRWAGSRAGWPTTSTTCFP